MCSIVCNEMLTAVQKIKLIEFLEQNNIKYNLIDCCCYGSCISFTKSGNIHTKCRCNTGIIVQTSNKNVCKIYPCEILYIAIENRKSVLYLTNKKVETNYNLEHWKRILNRNIFAQPHNSFIVNLNYVNEITKDFVIVQYNENKYPVYTSIRKISEFKKAFLNFKNF